MARIAGINIPQNKLVHIGLTYIYGIGDKFSQKICKSLEIPREKRVNQLTDEEILKIYTVKIKTISLKFIFHPFNISVGSKFNCIFFHFSYPVGGTFKG